MGQSRVDELADPHGQAVNLLIDNCDIDRLGFDVPRNSGVDQIPDVRAQQRQPFVIGATVEQRRLVIEEALDRDKSRVIDGVRHQRLDRIASSQQRMKLNCATSVLVGR